MSATLFVTFSTDTAESVRSCPNTDSTAFCSFSLCPLSEEDSTHDLLVKWILWYSYTVAPRYAQLSFTLLHQSENVHDDEGDAE